MARGALAIVLLAMTALGAVIYSIWQIDEAAIDAETERARNTLATIVQENGSSVSELLSPAYAFKGAHLGSVAEVAEEEVALPVPGTTGQMLIWTPRRLGTELFAQLAPVRISASVMFLIGIVLLMRRLYLVARELEDRRREAQELAVRDPLTGLGNRLAFDQGMERALAEGSDRLALFYLDLDGFKQVNDTLGHGAGDDVLRAVGERLTRLAGKADIVARLGGDEFAVVRTMPGPDADVVAFGRHIAAAVGQPVRLGNHAAQVGASIGIAVSPADGRSGAALLEAADAALYRAKRDRIGPASASAA